MSHLHVTFPQTCNCFLKYVGVLWFILHVLQLLQIRLMEETCVTLAMMHQQQLD
jgi:hypothetical protein